MIGWNAGGSMPPADCCCPSPDGGVCFPLFVRINIKIYILFGQSH